MALASKTSLPSECPCAQNVHAVTKEVQEERKRSHCTMSIVSP